MNALLNHRLLSTRGGTVLVGAFAAVIAGIFVLIYINQYRDSVRSSDATTTVLVAKRLIQKGTPGAYIGSEKLFVPTSVPRAKVRESAIADPVSFRGLVAAADIFPGQQLTLADFVPASEAFSTRLAQEQRAIAVPLDSAHGLTGILNAGDHVDVFVGFNESRNGGGGRPVVKLLMQNALVLSAPGAKTGIGAGNSSNVVLKVDYQRAAELAFATDNGRVWVVLRPIANVKPTPPEAVTVESILFGVKPVTVNRKLREFLYGSGAR